MDAERDKAQLVNQALIMHLGMPGTFSIDGEAAYSGIIDKVYEPCVAFCFSLTDWSFCRRTSKLTVIDAAPENGWQYGHTLPGDRIGPVLKFLVNPRSEMPLRDFTVEGQAIYSDAPEVWARAKVRVKEDAWDDAFAYAFTIVLGQMLAVPIKQDQALAMDLKKEAFGERPDAMAGGVMGRLIAQERAGSPVASPMYDNDPLTAAR
jgi:hypothetical protein